MYEPIGDGILVKKSPMGHMSKGGIVLPQSAQDAVCRGVVMAVGPGFDGNRPQVEVGDEVLYLEKNRNMILAMPIDDYFLISQSSVLLKVVPDEE